MSELAVLALTLFGFGLVSGKLRTTIVTGPMVFVAAGLLSGPEALDLAHIDLESEQVIIIAEATLSIVLFSDAVRVDPARLRNFIGIPARMLGLGLPLVIAAGTIVARVVLDVSWVDAALLASILAATDAALGQAVLTDESVPARIRGSLNVESGLNDGLALPAVTLFTAMRVAEAEAEPASYWIRFVAEQIGWGASAGLAVGMVGGTLLVRARRRGWVEGIGGQLAAVSLVGIAYALATGIGGNVFVAAFVAGVSFRVVGGEEAESLTEYAEDSGQLLASVTFVIFGNALIGANLDDLTVPIAICIACMLTIVRLVPVALSLVGTHLRGPTVLFLGWFGPRGLASILFALTVLEEGGGSVEDDMFVVVGWTVLVSVVLHGATASWGARRYGAWYAAHRASLHPDVVPSEGPMEPAEHGPRIRWARRSTRSPDP